MARADLLKISEWALSVGANTEVEIGVCSHGIFEVEVANATIYVGIGNLLLVAYKVVEILDSLFELLIQ